MTDTAKVRRIEVVDFRMHAPERGRVYAAYGATVELSVQDDGRTLKVFVTDAPTLPPESHDHD